MDFARVSVLGVTKGNEIDKIAQVTQTNFNLPGLDWLIFTVGGGWVGCPLHSPSYLMEIFFPSKQEVLCNSQWFGNVIPFDPQTGFSWSGQDSLHTQAALLSTTTHSWPAWHSTLMHGSKKCNIHICLNNMLAFLSWLMFGFCLRVFLLGLIISK